MEQVTVAMVTYPAIITDRTIYNEKRTCHMKSYVIFQNAARDLEIIFSLLSYYEIVQTSF